MAISDYFGKNRKEIPIENTQRTGEHKEGGSKSSSCEYYISAFMIETETIWGGIPKFKSELNDICFSRALMSFYENTPDAKVDRFDLSRSRFKKIISDKTFEKYSNNIPTYSFIPRILRNTCTLYNEAPQRIFTGDPETDKRFQTLYEDAGINFYMQEIHRLGKYTNTVAVCPTVDNDGIPSLRILPRDMFRIVTNPMDENDIWEFWHPLYETIENNKRRFVFAVYTPDAIITTNYKGEELSREENPYGMVPWIIYRHRTAFNNDPYGQGRLDLVEANIDDNIMRLMGMRSALYQSFQIRIAINMKLAEMGKANLMPDEIIDVNDYAPIEGGGGSDTPRIETVDGDTGFLMVDEFRKNRKKETMHDEGIPGFALDENGTPPTGVALMVMERELQRNQEEDKFSLKLFERRLVQRFAVIMNRSLPLGLQLPEILPMFSIKYANSKLFLEPKDELENKLVKWENGLYYTSTLVAEELGAKEMTEEQAADEIQKNLAIVRRVKTIQSDVPPPITPDVPVE